MKNTANQIEILYEIAMSVGKSLELKDMLENALSTYLQKLDCTAGIIYRKQRLQTDEFKNEIIFTYPTSLDAKKKFPQLSNLIPEYYSESDKIRTAKFLPKIVNKESENILHIMHLGEFGYIILVKNKSCIDTDILNQLKEILNIRKVS